MAKHQEYEEYKDSGVEWLGEIPSHWEISSLKRCVDGCTNGIWGSEPQEDTDNTIVLRVADFDRNKLEISEEKLTLRNISPKEAESRLLKKGDLLIEKSGGGDKTLVGCVVVFDKDFRAVTSNFVAKMTPKIGYESRFLKYAFALLYDGRVNYASIKQTTGIQNLDSDAYLMEKFVFPEKDEQTQIANFLDHETAQIDTLIEKQQTLIQMLKEKRQAVISHTVTKGLNPNAPMKDSGVEWLGEVPQHWEIMPLKYAVTFQRGHDLPAQNRTAGNVPLVTSAGISSTHDVAIAKAPGLVTGRYGTIGKFNLLEEDYWPLNTTLYSINLRGNNPKYLWYMLHNLTPIFLANSLKSAVPGVDRNDLHVVKVVIPKDLDEQAALCDYLEKTHCTYDLVIKKASESLVLLQERRTALISAAVTGKIDVRGWQETEGDAL